MKRCVVLFLVGLTARVMAGEQTLQIPNQLEHSWPGELVSFDLKSVPEGELSLEVQGLTRPVQRDGKRIWSYITIKDRDADGEKIAIDVVPAHLKTEKVAVGISVRKDGNFYLIDNGTYQFRLRNYTGAGIKGQTLGDVPHWCGGMRAKTQKDWDGKAYFESNAPVVGAKTELIASGPVFADFKITYEFEGAPDGEVEAMPLSLGKQSHLFKPNKLPRERIPRRPFHYELLIRFVMDDIWIDVNERFHFPRDEKASPFGITHYFIEWGEGGLPVDTVSWVRWFEYDKFGGNTTQQYVPAKPRPAQKGRPFALLRPRWNQGGGGAQDFVLTSGGAAPGRKTEAGTGYRPENPSVGVVAAYASKWIGPYVNYIPVYAYDGNRGRARFPMVDGERSGMHYGQRGYGLLVGPRSSVENLNSVVRRHTDWTLTAQINKYLLDWKRDPAKAGPNIYITREQLTQFQRDYKAGHDTPVNRVLKEKANEWKPLLEERDQLVAAMKGAISTAEKQVDELKQKAREPDAPKSLKTDLKKAEGKFRSARDKLKKDARLRELNKKLGGTDAQLYALMTTGEAANVKMPDSGLWRTRRYQDDFLNPTSSPTRKIPGFATADLFANGVSQGGPSQAAMGYIATDLDAWPGWHQGWRPGNPNFHTDKYMAAIYVGGALLDHPHAQEWLAFGLENFKDDARKVILAPDGVGAECPGYAGYAMKLQMDIARILLNTGAGNLMAKNPLVKKNGVWHRKLITPYDHRIERRHEAPIGDTHRWDSGMYAEGFAKLAAFFKKSDPAFASEMMGTWKLLKESRQATGKPSKNSLKDSVVAIDGSIEPMDAARMDWGSQAFEGFGSVMRDGFGTPGESYVSFKAGHTRGHYHNDENSYHFYAGGLPISVDYNCGYSPRGDHAALHNTMTFGVEKKLHHNGRGDQVRALEEITSSSRVLNFATTKAADVVVAERSSGQLVLRPIYPRDNEFGRKYPTRSIDPIRHQRSLVFVKHEEESSLSDYLVVRDVCDSKVPQQLNIHLLAREVRGGAGDRLFKAVGQYEQDMLLFLAEATEPRTTIDGWHYRDEWMVGPEPYILRPGESQTAWTARMLDLMKAKGVKSLPLPDWKPTWENPKTETNQTWAKRLADTNGEAMIPPPFWKGSWMYGEYQKWLRIETKPGTPITWVLYPYPRGTTPPEVTQLADGVSVSTGKQTDEIRFDGDKVTVLRNEHLTVLNP